MVFAVIAIPYPGSVHFYQYSLWSKFYCPAGNQATIQRPANQSLHQPCKLLPAQQYAPGRGADRRPER